MGPVTVFPDGQTLILFAFGILLVRSVLNVHCRLNNSYYSRSIVMLNQG